MEAILGVYSLWGEASYWDLPLEGKAIFQRLRGQWWSHDRTVMVTWGKWTDGEERWRIPNQGLQAHRSSSRATACPETQTGVCWNCGQFLNNEAIMKSGDRQRSGENKKQRRIRENTEGRTAYSQLPRGQTRTDRGKQPQRRPTSLTWAARQQCTHPPV